MEMSDEFSWAKAGFITLDGLILGWVLDYFLDSDLVLAIVAAPFATVPSDGARLIRFLFGIPILYALYAGVLAFARYAKCSKYAFVSILVFHYTLAVIAIICFRPYWSGRILDLVANGA